LFDFLNIDNLILFGTDKSQNMLDKIDRFQNPQVRCYRYDWLDLGSFFKKFGHFDLVYILGNSIAHIDSLDKLSKLFAIIKEGLKDNGKFVFDIRDWGKDRKTKQLCQKRRGKNTYISKGYSLIKENRIEYYEMCYYEGNNQYISYKILNNSTETEEIFVLSYLMFRKKDILESLNNAGFKSVDEIKTSKDYPYKVISVS
jgi:SAM-dependent methyltransferase